MMLLLGVSVITAAAEPLPIKPPSQGLVQPVWGLTGNCKPIDFDSVKIENTRPAGIYKLTITGIKPHTNMEVSLAREEYARKPAFWWSAVVGCVKNFIAVASRHALFSHRAARPICRHARGRDRRRFR